MQLSIPDDYDKSECWVNGIDNTSDDTMSFQLAKRPEVYISLRKKDIILIAAILKEAMGFNKEE